MGNIPASFIIVNQNEKSIYEFCKININENIDVARARKGKGYGDILFKELLKKCKEHGYKEIKLFPLKTNEATVKIMLKNRGNIVGDFKDEKHIILIPLQ